MNEELPPEKSSLHMVRNSRAILTELHEIRKRISHIHENFEAEENASSLEHKMIGFKMSHVQRRISEYEDATGRRDEILQELNQSFTDQMKRFMFDGENSAAILANTIIPEDLLDDLMNHQFSSEYDYAMKVNTKLVDVLKAFAKSDVHQMTKFVQVLKDAQGLGLEEKMMKIAYFFSNVPSHVQQELLTRVKGEKREKKLQDMKSNYSSQYKKKQKFPAIQPDKHVEEYKEETKVSVPAKQPPSHIQSQGSVIPELTHKTSKQMETSKETKQSSNASLPYHQYLNKLNQRVLEEARLQSKDESKIQEILEKHDFIENQKKNDPALKIEHSLHSVKQLEKDLKVHFKGKKNKWLTDLVNNLIVSLPSKERKKLKSRSHRSVKKEDVQTISLALREGNDPKEEDVKHQTDRSPNKPDVVPDHSKKKTQMQYLKETSPKLSSVRQSKQEQKPGMLWTNYTQVQIGAHVNTIKSNEAIIMNEGSLQKAVFNTTYPQLQVSVLPHQKAWGSWRVDRRSSYRDQWKQRRRITKSRTQLNNMPKFIKGQKIIAATIVPQNDTNPSIGLQLGDEQPQSTGKRIKPTAPKLTQTTQKLIQLPKIATFPDFEVKRGRLTAATCKLPLVPKHTHMYRHK